MTTCNTRSECKHLLVPKDTEIMENETSCPFPPVVRTTASHGQHQV